MSILRARQPALTRLTPHNGNKRYIMPNGGKTKGKPIPALAPFEWEARQNPSGWMTLPVVADIDSGFSLSFRCRVRVLNGEAVMASNDQFTFKTRLSGTQSASLVIGATTINCTMPAILPGVIIDWRLVFVPNETDGQAFVYANGVLVGSGNYALGTPISSPLYMLAAGTGVPTQAFQGIIENVVFLDENNIDRWGVHDGTGTIVSDSGTMPGGDGGVFANAGLSNWFYGTAGIQAYRYSFSDASTVDALEIDLIQEVPDMALTTAGIVLTKNPGAVNIPPTAALLINENKTVRIEFSPLAVIAGDRIQINYTRTGSTTLPFCTVNFNLPNALLLVMPT